MNPPVPLPSVAKKVTITSRRPIIGPTERSTPAVSSTTSWPIATKDQRGREQQQVFDVEAVGR